MSSSHARTGYRPDIDGLRAVAVLAVVAYHAFPAYFGGGFVGVDIFFVISGFLITGIILSSLQKGTFSFRNFYGRRIRRIFPALATVLATCLAIGWFVLMGGQYKQVGEHVAAGAGFVSNLVLWREAGYFDASAETKVLLHLWSLGVEEQFYLVWPLLLFVAARRKWSATALTGGILITSFAAGMLEVRTNPVAAFYSPGLRSWELMLGALLAQTSDRRVSWIMAARGANARSALGLGMILFAFVLIRRDRMFPGAWALLPVVGAGLVISGGPEAWVNRRFLSFRPLVWVGLISYPLYLWHWPLLVFERYAEYGNYSWQIRIAAVASAFPLAWLTAIFVELPVRSEPKRTWKVAIPATAVAMLFTVGLLIDRLEGLPSRFSGGVAEYEAYFENHPPERHYFLLHDVARTYRFDCDFLDTATDKERPSIDPSCYTPRSEKSVFLWGDSHAQQLYSGLSSVLPSDVSLLIVATSGCHPNVDPNERNPHASCADSNAFARAQIARTRPDVVVVAQAEAHEKNDLMGIAAWLRATGAKHVIVLGPVPQWHPPLHEVIARHYWEATPNHIQSYLMKNVFATNRALHAKFDGSSLAKFVSPIDNLCDERGCLAYLDGDRQGGLMTFDYGHLTTRGSLFVAQTILAPVIEQLLH
jgi:peptidoglycan/LPS O-acetylase OafA/YrhL